MTIGEGGGDSTSGGEISFSGLAVYPVGFEKGFTPLGRIDHGHAGATCKTWRSNAPRRLRARRCRHQVRSLTVFL